MDKALLKECINNKNNLLLFFKANWCGSCREVKPFLPKIQESKQDYTLYEIDCSQNENKDIEDLFKIEYLPTLIVLNESGYKRYVGTKKIKEILLKK